MTNPTQNQSNKPAFVTGFMWFAFSGTAMLSAVILPVHIWALVAGYDFNIDTIFHKLYFVVLFVAALYHGLYRTKTIFFDLGFTRQQKIIGNVCSALFIIFSLAAIRLLFFI